MTLESIYYIGQAVVVLAIFFSFMQVPDADKFSP